MGGSFSAEKVDSETKQKYFTLPERIDLPVPTHGMAERDDDEVAEEGWSWLEEDRWCAVTFIVMRVATGS